MSTAFGVFELGQVPDQAERRNAIHNVVANAQLVESLGFQTVWLAEHHFSNYGVVGSSQVLGAAIASATDEIGIGSAVTVIPFNHPVRTAEDFALLDILSDGRMRFGAGRAYQPAEFEGLGLPMEKSRQLFTEGMDVIEMAWSQDTVEYDGEYYKIPANPVLPQPVQTPPPIYMAAITGPSFDIAVERGWHLQLATPFSYRLYRERWLDEVEATVAEVGKRIEENGRDLDTVERALVLPFYVGETDEQARADFRDHVEWLYNRVTGLSAQGQAAPKVVAGYEQSMRESARTQELGLLSFEALLAADAVVCGGPEYCIEKLTEIRDRLGITEFMLFINLGGIAQEKIEDCVKLAAAEVIPHV